MACTDRDQGTGRRKQALEGAMDCYERAMSIINDVGNLLMTSLSSVSSMYDVTKLKIFDITSVEEIIHNP